MKAIIAALVLTGSVAFANDPHAAPATPPAAPAAPAVTADAPAATADAPAADATKKDMKKKGGKEHKAEKKH